MNNAPASVIEQPFRGAEQFREVYFIGIGGIGMSAIARFFQAQGARVSGYDKTPTVLTRKLEANGIDIHYEENIELIPQDPQLVVYTPAVPKEHSELVHYQKQGKKVVKRSDVLQLISQSSFNICIAGTHGKTTITTMVAHLLRDSGFGCNAFLGGISVNYGTNFWSSSRNVCVIEADEYDRSFLKLSPDIAIVTAMDADHLDIYGDALSVEQAFIDFTGRIKQGGMLIRQQQLVRGEELLGDNKLRYSLTDTSADVYATGLKMHDGSYRFTIVMPSTVLEGVELHMGGLHNVENVLAAAAAANAIGIGNEKIRSAIASFRGVKRRFEYVVKTKELVYVDDYAHHPEELKALIGGAKNLFPGRVCTVIFQPHLFSRTRDFADGFAKVLDMADEVILLPIYPARELPIPGVSSATVLERMNNGSRKEMTKEELMLWIKSEYRSRLGEGKDNLLITAGAGDIDTLVDPIREELS